MCFNQDDGPSRQERVDAAKAANPQDWFSTTATDEDGNKRVLNRPPVDETIYTSGGTPFKGNTAPFGGGPPKL